MNGISSSLSRDYGSFGDCLQVEDVFLFRFFVLNPSSALTVYDSDLGCSFWREHTEIGVGVGVVLGLGLSHRPISIFLTIGKEKRVTVTS